MLVHELLDPLNAVPEVVLRFHHSVRARRAAIGLVTDFDPDRSERDADLLELIEDVADVLLEHELRARLVDARCRLVEDLRRSHVRIALTEDVFGRCALNAPSRDEDGLESASKANEPSVAQSAAVGALLSSNRPTFGLPVAPDLYRLTGHEA